MTGAATGQTTRKAAASPAPARLIKGGRQWWNIVFVLLLVAALAGLGSYLFSPDWTRLAGDLPVGLRSPLMANYSADPLQSTLAPVNLSILGEALADRHNTNGLTPVAQLAKIMDDLRTPVPTVTPRPTIVSTNQQDARLTALPSPVFPTATEPATATPASLVTASGTIPATATATAVYTQTQIASRTPLPPATRTIPPLPTQVIVRPTASFTAVPTATIFLPSPTYGTINTPLPTRAPSSTSIPATKVPPTQMPTAIPELPTLTPQPTVSTPENPYPPPPTLPSPEETLPSYP